MANEERRAAVGRDESQGSEPRLSGPETPSASGALTTGLGQSGGGLDLAEAERVCGLELVAEGDIFILGAGSMEYQIWESRRVSVGAEKMSG